jgi:hypothetical protein
VLPSSEVEIRPRGRVALERGRSLLEGCQGWKPDGSLRLFGSWDPPCIGPSSCGVRFTTCEFVYILLFKKGFFPVH